MRTDIMSEEKRRYTMSKIRSKNTKPELRIKEVLDRMGVSYKYQAKINGRRVDFLLPEHKIVIEYRSCFWHWCPKCYGDRIPVKGGILGREWWKQKLKKNRERDARLEKMLRDMGYRLVVIWGHDKNRIEKILEEMLRDV